MRRVSAALCLLIAAVLLQAVAGSAQEGDDAGDQGDQSLVELGGDIYGAQCATCHAEAGRGMPEDGVPPLQGTGAAATDFYIRTGRMPLDDIDARPVHQEQKLTDQERRALVAYVRTLPGGGPEIPDPGGWQSADLSRGLELFTSNCAACHGPTGGGIAVGQEAFSSPLGIATPLEIAEAIRIGPGVMPVFTEDIMPQEDLEAVIAWVVHLRQRPAPGGAQIGRSGPVTEGLVAWLLGMGGLAIVMYLLGEKTSDVDQPPTGDEDVSNEGEDLRHGE